MTQTSLYRAGIIGCGRIADTIEDELVRAPAWSLLPYSHAGAYQRCTRTQLVAAADLNRERLETFGHRRGVERLYNDFREMLDRERLDIVSICVPTRAHAAVALDVAQRPVKGIYLEKPIAQPASNEIDARADLGIAVALHLSHRSGERVRLPVEDLDYVIEDPWGRDS